MSFLGTESDLVVITFAVFFFAVIIIPALWSAGRKTS